MGYPQARKESVLKKMLNNTKADPRNSVAANELDRDFTATKADEKCVTDVTFVPTDEGWLYLASMIDLYNREGSGLGNGRK